MNNGGVTKWLKDNAWVLITTFTLFAMSWATLNARVTAVEKVQVQYPSQDYFDEKFRNLEKANEDNKKANEKLNDKFDEYILEKK